MPACYHSDDLSKLADASQGAPRLRDKFQTWYADVFQDGALSAHEKALIAPAVANALQSPYCIDVYTKSSLENGSNLDQTTEALHVAAAIRSGATLAHGVQMKSVFDRLSM